MKLAHGGISVTLPDGWEARVRLQPAVSPGARGNVLLHAATVPLPAERGDFGSGVVETLGPDDVFVALFEYDPADARQPLFEARGLPAVRPADFSPAVLQRTGRGHSGAQGFFSSAGRAFCLHVVLGSHNRRAAGAARVAALLSRTVIEGRAS